MNWAGGHFFVSLILTQIDHPDLVCGAIWLKRNIPHAHSDVCGGLMLNFQIW